MDKRGQQQIEIHKVIDGILTANEAQGAKEFKALCGFHDEPSIDMVFGELLSRDEARSHYWLVEYLVKIEQRYGYKKLFELAGDTSEHIRELATDGITRINEDYKIDFLGELIHSNWPKQVKYVAEILGRSGEVRVVVPLAANLKKWQADEEVSVAIIKALARLRDRRAVPALVKIASASKNKKIQEEALSALTRFTVRLSAANIDKILSSDNPRVRAMAYLTIMRSQYAGWDKYIERCLSGDEERKTKNNILTIIKAIPTYRLFQIILKIAMEDPSEVTRLMALSAIKNTRSTRTMKWLLDYEKTGSVRERITVLKILTGFKDNVQIVDVLLERYKKGEDKRIELVAIECLGRNKVPRAVDFLTGIIEANGPYSMTAAVSLAHMMGPDDLENVEKILFLDDKEYAISVQVFLNFLLRLPEDCTLSKAMDQRIFDLTRSSDPQVRYLATRCLARTNITEKVIYLIEISKADNENYVKEAAAKSIVDIINRHPERGMSILFMCFDSKCLYFTLNRILGAISPVPEEFNGLVKMVLGLICRGQETLAPSKKMSLRSVRFMVFLRTQLKNNLSLFLKYIERQVLTDAEQWVMVHVLNSVEPDLLSGLDIDFMATQYRCSSDRTKHEYLKLFGKKRKKDSAVENLIFNEFAEQSNDDLLNTISDIVSAWTSSAISAGL